MNAIKFFITILFNSMSSWLNAVEKFGKSVENIATIAEEASGALADTSRIEREATVRDLYLKYNLTPPASKVLAAPITP